MPVDSSFGVVGEKTVPVPIGELLAVFAEPQLNQAWNERLAQQTLVYDDTGRTVAHQIYPMPWPLADRDFVLTCNETVNESALEFSSSCASVSHAAFPEDPTMVRGELVRSSWRFTAVPTGTTIRFESVVDPRGSIPKPVVQAAQRIGKDKLITALVFTQQALGRPPHKRFARWAEKAATAGRRRGVSAKSALPPSPKPFRSRLLALAVGLASMTRSVATMAIALPAMPIRLIGRTALSPARGLLTLLTWLLGIPGRPSWSLGQHLGRVFPTQMGSSEDRVTRPTFTARANLEHGQRGANRATAMSGSSSASDMVELAEFVVGVITLTGCLGLLVRRMKASRGKWHDNAWRCVTVCAAIGGDERSHLWAVDCMVVLAATLAISSLWFASCLPALDALALPLLPAPYPANDPRSSEMAIISAIAHAAAVCIGLAVGAQTRPLAPAKRAAEAMRILLLWFGAIGSAALLAFRHRGGLAASLLGILRRAIDVLMPTMAADAAPTRSAPWCSHGWPVHCWAPWEELWSFDAVSEEGWTRVSTMGLSTPQLVTSLGPEGALPFALVAAASYSSWLAISIALQHSPLGSTMLRRRPAAILLCAAAVARLLDQAFFASSALCSCAMVAIVALWALASSLHAAAEVVRFEGSALGHAEETCLIPGGGGVGTSMAGRTSDGHPWKDNGTPLLLRRPHQGSSVADWRMPRADALEAETGMQRRKYCPHEH
mmetsp:Transcript_25402/g.77055  ORF Transcript_25402/g.77055 Transcript_25402/m.77055 type:complete len:720 (+) Transcript_25402:82-2241(+)